MQNNSIIPETGIGVKKANSQEVISKEEFEKRIKQIAKSKRDIIWWAENFFKIVTLDSGLTQIKLYDKQKELLKGISENSRIVSLSARQTGKCVFQDSKVTIKNKKTNKIITLSIQELLNLISGQVKS